MPALWASGPRRHRPIRRGLAIHPEESVMHPSYLYAQAYANRTLRLPRVLPWSTEIVTEHEHALLYRRGRLVGVLGAGVHRFWGRHVTVVRLERRRQLMELPAQELQTVDGLTIKITATVTWQITDAVAAVSHDANHHTALYAAAQLVLRQQVAIRELAQVMAERGPIAIAMGEALAGEAAAIGLAVHAAAIKDIMPNAEARKALAAVAVARQEAFAALEKARGEHAALRALANAARLFKEQPELAQLRGLQVLAEGLRGGATVVVNAGANGLVPVKPGA
jgi:regulator of protease activity HflC (stomatin/prohibitin superfamily)